MNKILEDLKLNTKPSDLLSDEERAYQEKVINTFEHLAENNTTKSVKYVLEITAEELDITPLELTEILDKYYQEDEEDE